MINISEFSEIGIPKEEKQMNQKLVEVLSSIFGVNQEDILPELCKEVVPKWDSLRQMDLVISLEREFSIHLEIHDIIKMYSVAGIMDVLQSKGVELGD